MDKPSFIRKDQEIPFSQDFQALVEKGILYAQELSGKNWTDYNTHDPGVTILEQFCYGLTELGYKSSFPIEDLLIEGKWDDINWEKNSFHSPSLIFSSHPVTVNDFRKLLIDSFSEIQNCWLSPQIQTSGEEGVNGVYSVEIIPSLNFQKRLKSNPEYESELVEKISAFLYQNRNLGEDFEVPEILKPELVVIHANVDIDQQADVDRVMAEIIFSLEVQLYHPVSFSSLGELLEKGERIENIFSGPRLSRGFIQDSELKERSRLLQTEKLLHLISKIPNIRKCWELGFNSSGKEKKVAVPNHSYAAINTDPTSPDSVFSTIRIFVAGNLQRINRQKVSDYLLDLWSKNYRVYQVDLFKEKFWQNEIKGRFRNPINYQSIQHHFPGIYGLRKDGLSSHEATERHAKVRQLKGYLMLMEKHLANYLAQLSHTADFFDYDVSSEKGTYFSQDFETSIGKDNLEIKSKLDTDSNSNFPNPRTGETLLSWLNRKNRILDHLLARFGEQLADLPFQLSWKMNLIGTEEEMLSAWLMHKSRFLRIIQDINYVKYQAQYQFSDENKPLYVLQKILSLTLGIPIREHALVPDGLAVLANEEKDLLLKGSVKSKKTYQDFFDKFRPLSKHERIFKKFEKVPTEGFNFGKIGLKELFSRSVNPDCYWVTKNPRKGEPVEVLFQKSDSSWVSVWEGDSLNAAHQEISKNITFFRLENLKSEGMYIVDHILLRNLMMEGEFGFEIRDEWGNPTFRSSWVPDLTARGLLLQDFYGAAVQKKSYFKDSTRITIQDKSGRILAEMPLNENLNMTRLIESTTELALMMSGMGEISGRLALAEIEKLRLKGTLHKEGLYHQRSIVFLRKLPDGKVISEDFFDLKVSLILPDWPARFQEKHFKNFLENESKERVPAHLEITTHWLNLTDFTKFEALYRDWYSSTGIPSSSDNSTASLNLYEFLVQLKKGGLDD